MLISANNNILKMKNHEQGKRVKQLFTFPQLQCIVFAVWLFDAPAASSPATTGLAPVPISARYHEDVLRLTTALVSFLPTINHQNNTIIQYSFIVWLADRNHIKAQNEKVNIWKKSLEHAYCPRGIERYIECSMMR